MGKKRKTNQKVIRGGNFLDSLWTGIKTVAGPINSILKSTGIAGNLASAYNPTAGAVVKSFGYGKRQKGGSKTKYLKVIKT